MTAKDWLHDYSQGVAMGFECKDCEEAAGIIAQLEQQLAEACQKAKDAYSAGVQDERERCYKIAEETDIEPETCNEYGELTRKYDSWVNGANDACSQIAAAIRGYK